MNGSRSPRALGRIAAPFLLAALLAVLARLPAAAALPVLPLLAGPLGIALAGLGAGVALARWFAPGPAVEAALGRAPGAALALGLTLLYCGVGLRYAARLQAAGDEPHYLLMAQSLWQEHDLDLRDNYARRDFLDYAPGPLAPHYAAPRRDGRPYPAHSPGLPLLLAPLYALGGRPACVVALALIAALAAGEARRLALRLTGDERAAAFAWAAAAGPPLAFYSFHVYTEGASALCAALSLRLLLGAPGAAGAALAALAASALPWLHLKMAPAAAALAVVAALRLRGRSLAVFFGTAALMAAGFLAYYQSVFGTPSPLAIYGGVPRDASGAPLTAALGLLLDRSFGLLPAAPLFLLALPGLGALLRRDREGWALGLVGASILAPLLAWRMWWGGMCPPARFLVPLVPILAASIAAALAQARGRGLARWRGALLGLGLGLTALFVARPADALLLNRADRPTRVWEALAGEGGASLGDDLPSFVAGGAQDWRVAGVWLAGLALLLLLHRLARRDDRVDAAFRGLGAPAVLVALLLLVVEVGARAPR